MNCEVYLKRKDDKVFKSYIKYITFSEIDKLLEFQDNIVETMKDKVMYTLTTKEEFEYYFNNKGIIIGCYIEERNLIAYGVCIKYDNHSYNNGYYIDVDKNDLKYIAQIDSVAVSEKFRGNKLQY
ncbi:MAG: hypothetical protein RR942_02460 [Romboutsia sp.]